MRCPYCLHPETSVVDSRDADNIDQIRRRRECLKCKKRFTTFERVELIDLMVVKKDGKRQPFSRQKVLDGIVRSCVKLPVSPEKIEKCADEIEMNLRKRDTTEVKSSDIGELVMKKLKRLDKVAYIRFASVYRKFVDVADFQKELKDLRKKE
ncbi:transcriptional repressor NrdR [Candidatus Parvarchaeota archaeon]|nr:transcriptional repressor NrdR [Candidatus Parvarchaeota archaeon]